MKKIKLKKCKVCKKKFQPFSSLAKTCRIACAIQHAKEDNRKQDRKEHREAKQRIKSRADHLKDAQTACNAYIRERDREEGCISCETISPNIQYCAGHYKTKGARPDLRFHPFNINKQCNSNCNLHLSGAIDKYRPALIKKIGIENVEWLESERPFQKLEIEDIIEIKIYYREQLKLLKNQD